MKRNLLLLFIIGLFLLGGNLYGQEFSRKGKVGLTATIQASQYGVMIPVFIGEKFALAPAVDFKFVQDQGSELSIGVVPRYYFRQGTFSPYLGLRLGAIMYFPSDNGTSTTDLIVGPAFGGEYFFNEHFSVGLEAQANISLSDDHSDRFGNPGNMNLNLATMLSASIYF